MKHFRLFFLLDAGAARLRAGLFPVALVSCPEDINKGVTPVQGSDPELPPYALAVLLGALFPRWFHQDDEVSVNIPYVPTSRTSKFALQAADGTMD